MTDQGHSRWSLLWTIERPGASHC